MRDQRVKAGPSLGRIDRGDRLPVAGIPAQAIDGFGGERDQQPLPQKISSLRDTCRRGWQILGAVWDHGW